MQAVVQLFISVAILAGVAHTAVGHDLPLAKANVVIDSDGKVTIRTMGNLPSFILGEPPERVTDEMAKHLLSLSDEELRRHLASAESRFREALSIRVRNGDFVLHDVSWPDVEAFRRQWSDLGDETSGQELLSTVVLRGQLTGDAGDAFRLRFPPGWGHVATNLRVADADTLYVLLSFGEESGWVSLSSGQWLERPGLGWASVARRYLVLGVEHIVPKGLDHILFVLGLFLLSVQWRPLLAQVTTFTVAHSMTLALSLYGVVRLPPHIVEPLIAASIVYVGIENMLTDKLHHWRPLVVFGFGLLHGLGFAGVLMELGLPRQHFVPALLFFNVGVELGQLMVLAGAFAAVGLLYRKPWYRPRVAIPASACIALVALFWTVERLVGVS